MGFFPTTEGYAFTSEVLTLTVGGGVGLRTLWRREVTLESLVAFLRVGLDIWEQRKTSD